MKNKLKKSKIIVPSLALITATTVASVTGTVAWFTASRVATVTGTSFHTTTLNSNLKVKVESLNCGVATPTTNEGDAVDFTVDGKLTHGSYNAQTLFSDKTKEDAEGNDEAITSYGADLFTPIMDNYAVTGYVSKGRAEDSRKTDASSGTTSTTTDKWLAGKSGTTDVWYAVAWKMTFSVDSLADGVTSTVHFDPLLTTFKDKENGDTIKGFRVALMSNSNFYVAGGDDEKTHVAKAGTSRFAFTQEAVSSSTPFVANKYYPASGNNKAMTEKEFDAAVGNIYTRTGNEGSYTYTKVSDKSSTSWSDTSSEYYAYNGATTKMTKAEFEAAKAISSTTVYTRTLSTGYETKFADENYSNVCATNKSFTYPADNSTASIKTTDYKYLGDLNSTTTSLTVIAVAWFEGTDSNIVTNKTTNGSVTNTVMSDVVASLSFFSRETTTTGE